MSVVGDMLGQIVNRQPWTAEALCAQVGAELFFVDKGENPQPAKDVCALCPVRRECLEYALSNDERFGVWGGKTERERRRLRREQRRDAPPLRLVGEGYACEDRIGTLAGYRRHRRAGESPCRSCRQAQARRGSERRASK